MRSASALLAVAALLSLVAGSGDSRNGPERNLPPACLPGWCSHEAAPGIGWKIRMAEELTTFDSVWVESVLENWAATPVVFEPDSKVGPSVILTQKGKPAQTRPVAEVPGPQWISFQRKAQPDATLHSFRIDLRAYFGDLKPGTYQVHLAYPAKGYKLRGPSGFMAQDLKSSVRTLRVASTSIEQAAEYARSSRDVVAIKREGKIGDDKAPGKATLTNAFFLGVLVPVVPPSGEPPEKVRPPFRLRVGYQRWCPRHGWYFPRPLPEDGKRSGLAYHELKRDGSVAVLLPDAELDGDGLYRYAFRAYELQGRGASSLGYGYSEPFVVDRFRAAATSRKK